MTTMTSVRLKNIATLNDDQLREDEDPEFVFEYVDVGSVGLGFLVDQPEKVSFGEAPTRARRWVKAGDTIVSTVRTYLRAILPIDEGLNDVIVSTGFAVVRPRPGIDHRFLAWALQSDSFVEEVVARSTGVSYPAIAPSGMADIPVSVPAERSHQQLAADFLDRETHRIDALIGAKRRMIDLLHEKLQGAIDAAIPATELVMLRRGAAFWNSNVDKVINESEEPALLCNYTDVYYGSYLESTEGFQHGSVTPTELVRYSLQRGDVLITKDSETADDIGVPAYVAADLDAVCGYHLTMIRCDPERWRGAFLYWAFRSQAVRDQLAVAANGVTRFGLTQEAIGSLKLPMPDTKKQGAIEERLRRLSGTIDAAEEAFTRQLDLLAEYRQALITQAVTGQLDEATLKGHKPIDEAVGVIPE